MPLVSMTEMLNTAKEKGYAVGQFNLNNLEFTQAILQAAEEEKSPVIDQYGIRILLNEVFNKEGYQTFQAANGLQALDIVTKERPDLVLLDMKIPGMDGIEILKRMKVIDENIRVIIMTAYGELDMIDHRLSKQPRPIFNRVRFLILNAGKNTC